MSVKIGPIQTGEEKTCDFDFGGPDSDVTGSISIVGEVSVTAPFGGDPDPDQMKVGGATVQGLRVLQKIRFRQSGVTYLLQCTVVDSAGDRHTSSGWLLSRAVA